jgi:DNA-binding transcriptional ArsR family regulator
MGWWQVSADTLAGGRFVVSPLAEVTGSLITLVRGTAPHAQGRAWLDAHRPAYRALLAADPVMAALVTAGVAPRWIASLFTMPPLGSPASPHGFPVGPVGFSAGPQGCPVGTASPPGARAAAAAAAVTPGPGAAEETFAAELARIRELPPGLALAELSVDMGSAVPAFLRRPDLPERAAGLLRWIWTEAVLPYWPRRRQVLEADIVARTVRLAQGGWAAALADMRPGLRWLGEGRLQVNVLDYPPREISGSQLFFVPVTQGHGWVAWDEPYRYAVMYPCSGILASPPDPGPPARATPGRGARVPPALGALIGPARAGILILLDTPKSTTQLVALTGQPLGSVGRHLKVLHEAGLASRRRAGRSVLYYRTPLGDSLVTVRPLSKRCLRKVGQQWYGATSWSIELEG